MSLSPPQEVTIEVTHSKKRTGASFKGTLPVLDVKEEPHAVVLNGPCGIVSEDSSEYLFTVGSFGTRITEAALEQYLHIQKSILRGDDISSSDMFLLLDSVRRRHRHTDEDATDESSDTLSEGPDQVSTGEPSCDGVEERGSSPNSDAGAVVDSDAGAGPLQASERSTADGSRDPEPEMATEHEPETDQNLDQEMETDQDPDQNPDPDTQPEPDLAIDLDPNPGPEMGLDPDPVPDTQPDPDPETDQGLETEQDSDQGPDPDPNPEVETQREMKQDPDTESETEMETKQDTDQDLDSNPGTEMEQDPDPDPDQELETEEDPIRRRLVLLPEEMLFLSHGLGCVRVTAAEGAELAGEWLYRHLSQGCGDRHLAARYAAYLDLRSRGWVVRDGLLSGADFVVYRRGPAFYHAALVVFIQVVDAESRRLRPELNWRRADWLYTAGLCRTAEQAAKVRSPRTDITRLRPELNWRRADWLYTAGLCCTAEQAAKDVLLVRLLWPSDLGLPTDLTYLRRVAVQHVLVRRWTPGRLT